MTSPLRIPMSPEKLESYKADAEIVKAEAREALVRTGTPFSKQAMIDRLALMLAYALRGVSPGFMRMGSLSSVIEPKQRPEPIEP